jgi:tetratricopeptide (TPR) repeat protein
VGPTPSISQQIPEGVDRAEWADYKAGVALYSQGRHEEALAAMIKLARARPQPMAGVLGMAVASLASTSPTPDVVARYVAEAERDRKDTVNQFLAGVAAHYCGHRQATTKAEKVQLYTTSLEYLNRTLPQYEQEPRVHIYLGVSYFRLGQQEAAEKHINRAVALGSNDADSYYCRAEVYHRKDPAKAIADIEKYLQISEEMSRREGSSLSKDKQQRVREMLAALRAVTPGQQPPDGLWDPLRVATFDLSNKLSPRFFAAATLSVGALAGVAWLLVSRAARRRTGKSPAA